MLIGSDTIPKSTSPAAQFTNENHNPHQQQLSDPVDNASREIESNSKQIDEI